MNDFEIVRAYLKEHRPDQMTTAWVAYSNVLDSLYRAEREYNEMLEMIEQGVAMEIQKAYDFARERGLNIYRVQSLYRKQGGDMTVNIKREIS